MQSRVGPDLAALELRPGHEKVVRGHGPNLISPVLAAGLCGEVRQQGPAFGPVAQAALVIDMAESADNCQRAAPLPGPRPSVSQRTVGIVGARYDERGKGQSLLRAPLRSPLPAQEKCGRTGPAPTPEMRPRSETRKLDANGRQASRPGCAQPEQAASAPHGRLSPALSSSPQDRAGPSSSAESGVWRDQPPPSGSANALFPNHRCPADE